jgi:hypothetical protein
MLNSAYKHRNNRKQARVKTVCYKLGEREKGPRIYNVTKNSTADYIFISCFCSQLCKTITINTCFRPTMKDQIVYVNQMWMLSLNEERHGTNDLTHRAQGRFAQPGDRTSMKIPLRLHARSWLLMTSGVLDTCALLNEYNSHLIAASIFVRERLCRQQHTYHADTHELMTGF